MSCYSCTKPFSLFRKEKGCPSCGFSYCSKCLDNKWIFLASFKKNSNLCDFWLVCAKCKNNQMKHEEPKLFAAPDAYYRRTGAMEENQTIKTNTNSSTDPIDNQILKRLEKLREGRNLTSTSTTEDDIQKRLQNIKGETPSTSDAELYSRLAKLKGVPPDVVTRKTALLPPDTRTEQEQANDLIKQYIEQTDIDTKYKDEFDSLISSMESRVLKLKGSNSIPQSPLKIQEDNESENEEETVQDIVKKIKAEASLKDDDILLSDELPFCEICNEDATMRCLGCRYLFCKRCFLEHKDDDGCDRYELYEAPKMNKK